MNIDQLLISPAELAPQIGMANWVVVDCRADLHDPNLGRQQYLANHIPSAQFADLASDLSGRAGLRGRHPLPTRLNFWGYVRSIGISNDTNVVAYDDRASSYACRFWWLMRWLGHTHTRVLDGGFAAWTAGGFPVTPTILDPLPGKFTLRASRTRHIEMTDVDGDRYTLIDARTQERFQGLIEPIDHTAGHIPGALCHPFQDNLNDDGTFAQGQTRFSELQEQNNVVCYCGSGVTATHNIFAMLLAGFENEPMLYPGSWSEWIEHPENAIATGS